MNMKRFLQIRFIPVLIVAITCLLTLRLIDIVVADSTDQTFETANTEMLQEEIITGQVDDATTSQDMAQGTGFQNLGNVIRPEADRAGTPLDELEDNSSRRLLLERLQQRRDELDGRYNELDMRESLLRAAEQRLESRLDELRDAEQSARAATEERDRLENERFRDIVTMYEAMKAKDAARVFNRLDINLLVELAGIMRPAKLADIVSEMDPAAAERLTVEMANRSGGLLLETQTDFNNLPQIQGVRPQG